MNRATFWAPAAALAFGIIWFAGTARPAGDPPGEMRLSRAAALPVLDGGRVKPLDSFARVHLMELNRRQTYYDEFEKRQQAVTWFLNLYSEGYAREQMRAPVAVNDPGLLAFLGVRARPDGLFGLRELLGGGGLERIEGLSKKQPEKLTPQERAAMEWWVQLSQERQAMAKKILEHRTAKGAGNKALVFRVDNDQVLEMLGLQMRDGLRYSYNDIVGVKDDPKKDGPDDDKYFRKFYDLAKKARASEEKDRDLTEVKAVELLNNLSLQNALHAMDGVLMVPPSPSTPNADWKTLQDAVAQGDANTNPNAAHLEKIVRAYGTGDVKAFNREVEAYGKALDAQMPGEMRKVRFEAWFNNFAPFYQCALLYVVVGLLAVASWLVWHEPLRRAAFALAALVCLVHTLALAARIYLTGRPPVTNLYSSAVFIGWGCVLLCLAVEFITRRNRFVHSIALTVAATLGFATMIVAHHLGGSGDSMGVMQAVLDTNFWLATHVTTVTLGYAATFGAGFLAMLYVFLMLASAVRSYFADRKALAGKEMALFVTAVLGMVAVPAGVAVCLIGGLWLLLADGEPLSVLVLGVLSIPVVAVAGVYGAMLIIKRLSAEHLQTPEGELPQVANPVDFFALRQQSAKALAGVIYGVICFATLLSFVGTVLGGIWADQSWGRFWGWDPKENGALLIVVMNALILHARWSGLIRERGLCVLALLGNMITAWSWFGTNQLGVGLHAYGFNNTLAVGCRYFWLSQLALAGLAMMPLRFWRAYADDRPLKAASPAIPPGPRLVGGRKQTGIQTA